jgi:hypothetical protein
MLSHLCSMLSMLYALSMLSLCSLYTLCNYTSRTLSLPPSLPPSPCMVLIHFTHISLYLYMAYSHYSHAGLISTLYRLEALSLDNNEITDFPEGVLQLTELRSLWLRQVCITPLSLCDLSPLSLLSASPPLALTPQYLPLLPLKHFPQNKITSLPAGLDSLSASLQVT